MQLRPVPGEDLGSARHQSTRRSVMPSDPKEPEVSNDSSNDGNAVPSSNNDDEEDLLLLMAGFALFPLLCRRPGSSR